MFVEGLFRSPTSFSPKAHQQRKVQNVKKFRLRDILIGKQVDQSKIQRARPGWKSSVSIMPPCEQTQSSMRLPH